MATKTVSENYEALREDLNNHRADVAALTESLVETGKGRATAARQSAVAEARQRLEQLSERVQAAREQGRETVERIERQVAANPWRSIATIFGVGLLVGMIVNWMSRRNCD